MLALPEDSGPPVCSEGVEETPGRSWEGLCPLAPRAAQQQKPPAFEGWPRSACSLRFLFRTLSGKAIYVPSRGPTSQTPVPMPPFAHGSSPTPTLNSAPVA
uniref:Uncharacterized protein n=1 Tax=Rangifer tarandus platyrhynchus TaxID=3082113 RepID=A0ACB0E5E9_RANTA|nr:unnamed protein product [Rangifer tarandus platyrhynchus]